MDINWTIIIVQLILAIPAVLAWINAREAKTTAADTHQLVNSRMTELLALARVESAATATLKEKNAETIRQATATNAAASATLAPKSPAPQPAGTSISDRAPEPDPTAKRLTDAP